MLNHCQNLSYSLCSNIFKIYRIHGLNLYMFKHRLCWSIALMVCRCYLRMFLLLLCIHISATHLSSSTPPWRKKLGQRLDSCLPAQNVPISVQLMGCVFSNVIRIFQKTLVPKNSSCSGHAFRPIWRNRILIQSMFIWCRYEPENNFSLCHGFELLSELIFFW